MDLLLQLGFAQLEIGCQFDVAIVDGQLGLDERDRLLEQLQLRGRREIHLQRERDTLFETSSEMWAENGFGQRGELGDTVRLKIVTVK